MTEKQAEKVILEAKLGGEQKNVKKEFKLNEKQAVVDIAKNLIQDYTFVLTMATVKAVFGGTNDCDKLLERLVESWQKRTSAQLAAEAKSYQDAVFNAFDGSGEVKEETSEEVRKYLNAYSNIRDKAVEIAKSAINDINNMILSNNEQETTTETKEEK